MADAFTEQEITECLMAVIAWAGSITPAHKQLLAQGKHTPSYSALSDWVRSRYADRYNDLREKYAEQLEQQLANEYRDVARLAVEVERLALDKSLIRLRGGEDRDPSRTAANAATVADKMTSKLLSLTGRPTSIREDRNLEEILRSLAARKVITLPDEPEQLEPGRVEPSR